MKHVTCNRRSFLKTAGLGAATLATGIPRGKTQPTFRAGRRQNVLFIAVDDLRPQLGCYGHSQMKSPYIDSLADSGTLFARTYCQVPVCGASRASLLTGVRPTRHRFIDYYTRADDDLPGALTLPRLFLDSGYTTISNGKVYHHADDDLDAWTEMPWRPSGAWTGRGYLLSENQKIAKKGGGRGPAFENADVPDGAYHDGVIADKAVADLNRLSGEKSPFFLAVGFMKPHLPFNAPTKYWNMYKREKLDLADNPFAPKGVPDAALHNWVELRQYYGIPPEGPLPEETARTLVHGYYACVSYTDAQIGRLLNELDRLRIADNTIVVLWGDHGWHLGEHGLWCKHCNFENVLHAPLVVRGPGITGGNSTRALTEFVDIYPSLAELCSIELPEHLQGSSFVPLMSDPDRPWKKAAFSRYFDGDSIKTDRYRYTEWTKEIAPPGLALRTNMYARMLFDHETDPGENVNIAELPEHRATVEELSGMLKEGWESVKK